MIPHGTREPPATGIPVPAPTEQTKAQDRQRVHLSTHTQAPLVFRGILAQAQAPLRAHHIGRSARKNIAHLDGLPTFSSNSPRQRLLSVSDRGRSGSRTSVLGHGERPANKRTVSFERTPVGAAAAARPYAGATRPHLGSCRATRFPTRVRPRFGCRNRSGSSNLCWWLLPALSDQGITPARTARAILRGG